LNTTPRCFVGKTKPVYKEEAEPMQSSNVNDRSKVAADAEDPVPIELVTEAEAGHVYDFEGEAYLFSLWLQQYFGLTIYINNGRVFPLYM